MAAMAASNTSVIAGFCVRIYLMYTIDSQATALGHLSSLTTLVFRALRSNLFQCLSDGIPINNFGIAAVTTQRL
jgi:hypothetical protein